MIQKPQWFDCYPGKGLSKSGSVLVSFDIVKLEHVFKAEKLENVGLESMVKRE